MLARRLKRLGYERVDSAEDGVECLAAVRARALAGDPYDVVLLDVMMPRVSGVEALETMVAEAHLEETAVIMISAATEIETVVRCIELGAEDYLPKPFNPTLLRARLGTVLEKKRLRDEVRRQLARIEAELAEARRQQLAMLPDTFPDIDPAYPTCIHAVMTPARQVGGDLYDCFEAAPGVLCVAVGDVSDKGMPAALFMARTRSLLRASALQHVAATGAPPAPSALAAIVNEELCKNNPICMFVTMMLGFYEVATGRLAFVNAGHVRPWLLSGEGAREIRERPGPPLGVISGARYRDYELTLSAGEGLVMITDGLPEMIAPDGAFYTLERIAQDLHALRAAAPQTITQTLLANVVAFAAGEPAADDVTVLALRRGGA